MSILTKFKTKLNLLISALRSKQLNFDNSTQLYFAPTSGYMLDVYLACIVLGIVGLMTHIPLSFIILGQLGLATLLSHEKITRYLKESKNYETNVELRSKVHATMQQPTFLASFNSLHSDTSLELENDELSKTVIENNLKKIYTNKDWNEVNMEDLPLTAMYALQKEKLENEELTKKESRNWESLLDHDYNFFFYKYSTIGGAVTTQKVPYCFLSKKGNDIKVYLHKSVIFKSIHEKQKLFSFFKNEFPLIGETLDNKISENEEYLKCQEWVKNQPQIATSGSENQLINALITEQDIQMKLLESKHHSIQSLLEKVDVKHLSVADIDSINLVIKSMNEINVELSSDDYTLQMYNQFKDVLKNILKHQSNIRIDDLLKKDVYYLTERFRNMNRQHKPNYLKKVYSSKQFY